MQRSTDFIYVMLPAVEYDEAVARGYYRPDNVDEVGYIHAAPVEQLTRIANKYYRDKKDVRVLHVDATRVRAEIRWEPATGRLDPHIFGPLNLDAVVRITRAHVDSDGKYRIDPKELLPHE